MFARRLGISSEAAGNRPGRELLDWLRWQDAYRRHVAETVERAVAASKAAYGDRADVTGTRIVALLMLIAEALGY
jgi:hypothetical protein